MFVHVMMFTTINNNKYKNICILDMFHVKIDITQIMAHYWNFIRGHKGLVDMPAAVANCSKPKFALVTVRSLLP